jgi:hypothetical protein
LHGAALDVDVARAQGGQAEGLVGARIFLIADTHHRQLQQVHDGGQHFFAGQARQLHARDGGADGGQGVAKAEHALVLDVVAHLAPARMVAVLLAAPRIAARRLHVAVRARTDPHIGPGGRNGQCLDARQDVVVAHGLAVRIA